VQKSTTLDDLERPICTVAEKMHLSEPTTKICMKIDPYHQQQKCRPVILVSGGITFMRIFAEVPWGGGIKRQWGCRQRQFSAFSLAISSETLEMKPALLYSDMESVVGFSVIPKCLTLNGYFALNSVFMLVWLAETMRLSKNNCVKSNKDRHILSAVQIFGRDSIFWQYKICSGSLERRR